MNYLLPLARFRHRHTFRTQTFIRVGSCGAIQPEMNVGDLVITTGAVRQEGTSDEYVREDYPAVADYEVVSALVAAAEGLGYEYHTGLTMSADSFYAGQGRPGYDGFRAAGSASLLEDLKVANVTNIEMEASAMMIHCWKKDAHSRMRTKPSSKT